MFSEKRFLHRAITLADFAEHPADGLVNQIVRVVDQDRGDPKGCGKLAALDPMKCREHRDATLPQMFRASQLHQYPLIASIKVRTDDKFSG